jgi:DnaJ family protein C protein 7
MPSLFTRKKSTPSPAVALPQDEKRSNSIFGSQGRKDSYTSDTAGLRRRESVEQNISSSSIGTPSTRSVNSSPEKKSRSSFVKEREIAKDKNHPKSQRNSKSYSSKIRRHSDEHPLNLPPDELKRLSALSAASMSSPREDTDAMEESTPAPQTPGAFPQSNGTNGSHSEEDVPAPPPHKTPASPPPQPEVPAVDAERCKEAGNKFYKAKQYDKAIEEYTKGRSRRMVQDNWVEILRVHY